MEKSIIKSVYFPSSINLNKKQKPFLSLPDNQFRFYSLARFALKDVFQDLGLKPGDEVIIPSFICRDVLASLNELGLKPVYYDVDRSLNPINLVSTYKSKVVLAVNFFGFPFNFEVFKKFSIENNLVLIEDNAHGFLSKNEDEEWLGTRGDYSIFSFRKTIPVIHGAMLLKKDYSFSLIKEETTYLEKHTFINKKNERIVFRFLGLKAIQLFTTLLRLFRSWRTGSPIPVGSIETEKTIPGSEQTFNFNYILKFVDSDYERNRRQILFYKVKELLKDQNITPIFDELNNVAPFCFPFYCSKENISDVKLILKKHFLECFQWPDVPSEVKEVVPSFYNDVWCVRFLW